jgi:hypothetical protein
MEDLEEYYEEENEKNNEEFIEKLKGKREIEKVEKEYKDKTKNLRKKYEKEYKNNLENEKKKEIENIKNKTKSKKLIQNKTYEVNSLDLELTWKERTSLEIASKEYKLKRKLNDFYEKIMPNRIIYFNYKLKKNISRTLLEIKEFTSDTFTTIINGLIYSFAQISKYFVLFFSKIGEIIKNIMNKMSKKKKEGKEDKEKNGKRESSGDSKEKPSSN